MNEQDYYCFIQDKCYNLSNTNSLTIGKNINFDCTTYNEDTILC